MAVQAGDSVKWAKSGGVAKGKVVSVHANSTVPHTNPKVHGTPENPAVKVNVHTKNEDGSFSPTKAYVAVAADQLTSIDSLPGPAKASDNVAHMPGRGRGIDHRMVSNLEIRDASTTADDGTVTYQFWARIVGYNMEDTYGTDFLQGVFNDYLNSHTNRPTLLYGHGGSFGGIGAVLGHRSDWREDASGCDILFTFDDFDAVPNARQAWAQLMSGTFDSFSVGFIRRAERVDEDGGCVHIVTADLPETSIVIEPSNPGTGVLAMSGQRGSVADQVAQILIRYSQGECDLADAMTEARDVLAHPDGGTGDQAPPAASDDNVKQLAANVDAAIDAVRAEITNPTSDDSSQAGALVDLATAASDALLDSLGVDDPDDPDDDGARESERAEIRDERRSEARKGNPFAAGGDKPATGKGAAITKGTFVKGPGVNGVGTVTSDPMMGTVSVKGADGKVVDDVKTKPLSVVSADDKKKADDAASEKKSAEEAEMREALALVEGR